jgi:hypothetical protein
MMIRAGSEAWFEKTAEWCGRSGTRHKEAWLLLKRD